MKPYALAVIGIRLMAIFIVAQQLGFQLNLIWPAAPADTLTLGDVLQLVWNIGVVGLWVLFIASLIWFFAAPLARWMVRGLDDTPVTVSITAEHLLAVLLTVIGAYLFVVNLPNTVSSIWVLVSPPKYFPAEHIPRAMESWLSAAVGSGISVLLGIALALMAPSLARWLSPDTRDKSTTS